MDEKPIEEVQSKATRSRARHLRRKRLTTARRIAEANANCEINSLKRVDSVSANTQKSHEITQITKSKARRLKNKNKNISCRNQELSEKSEVQTTYLLNEHSSVSVDKIELELLQNEENLLVHNSKIIDNNLQYKFPVVNNTVNLKLTKNKITETDDTLLFNENKNLIDSNVGLLNNAFSNMNSLHINEHLNSNNTAIKMNSETKTREQIKAEREAKKAAKAAAKNKNVQDNSPKILSNEIVAENVTLTSKLTKLSIVDADKKSLNSIIKNEGKSKAELRAERRLKQEAQRAAKQAQLEIEKTKGELLEPTKRSETESLSTKTEEPSKKSGKKVVTRQCSHEISLFKHLYHEREQAHVDVYTINSNIHPAIIRLGVQYANKIIVGSNARCIALLATITQLIEDFERPAHADFNRGLEAALQESSSYLHHCRPLAVSMHNALRHLKWQMSQLPSTISDNEAKSILIKAIGDYTQEQITLAAESISIKIRTKISNGDVILTYGFSSLIQKILCDAYDAGRQFRVVVVDGRPWLEGKELLRRLANHGIECSYMLINALSFIMPEVNKVFLGAHAILANGAVMARAGTAQVALMAKAFNVPVLVSCEMHKSSERVQTDSIIYNEIDDADKLIQNYKSILKKNPLSNWRMKKTLNLLNIMYDVTPADLVTGVVTELAILPCSSVPVILRIKPSEI